MKLSRFPWEFTLALVLFSAWWLKDTPPQDLVPSSPALVGQNESIDTTFSDLDPNTLEGRFPPPAGLARVPVVEGSFPAYLRALPLKPAGSPVHYFDGRIKANPVHAAVIDLELGTRDLQQCADAIMRLQAEYLFTQQAFDQIQFPFTNGFQATYAKWRAGFRIRVQGNEVGWVKRTNTDGSYESFRKYLDMVFAYAGTTSLDREAYQIDPSQLRIGDIFVQSGSPGHAVIVVDLAEHPTSGEKVFLLAQSYMPAQDIHVLKNPGSASPWYSLSEINPLYTPEWTFDLGSLQRIDLSCCP